MPAMLHATIWFVYKKIRCSARVGWITGVDEADLREMGGKVYVNPSTGLSTR
jgi:hypothetical protein